MPYKVVYKTYAERDIWEIADYLSDHSVPAAEKFLSELKSKIEGLAEMPLMYPKIDLHREYRKMAVGNYIMAYIVNEQTKEVLIMRVVHGRRNYQNSI
jgi:plasmid stabilization system protein ParE